jgi:hypothetical protein
MSMPWLGVGLLESPSPSAILPKLQRSVAFSFQMLCPVCGVQDKQQTFEKSASWCSGKVQLAYMISIQVSLRAERNCKCYHMRVFA